MKTSKMAWIALGLAVGCGESKQSDVPSWQVDEDRELRELLASIKPSTAKLPQLNPLDTTNQDCEPSTPSYPSMCEWMLGVDDLVIAEVVDVLGNDSYYNTATREIVDSKNNCIGVTIKTKIKIKKIKSIKNRFDDDIIYIGHESYWTNYPQYNEDTNTLTRWKPNPTNYLIKPEYTIIFPVFRSKKYNRWTTSSEVLFNITRVGDELMVTPQAHLPATCIQLNLPIEPMNLRTGVTLPNFLSLYQQCAESPQDPNLTDTWRIREPRMLAEDPVATYSACYNRR